MTVLAIDRSTDAQSVALAVNGSVMALRAPNAVNWIVAVRDFLMENGVAPDALDSIVVGTGPGSFAGIRGALSFAQGLSLGIKARRAELAGRPVVHGVPSAMAAVREGEFAAVVGDARRGLFWIAAYEGARVVQELRLATREELPSLVPDGATVVTPDGARIEPLLSAVFGHHYKGSLTPLASRLLEVALAHPDLPRPEPLPLYLQPPVR